MNKRFVKEASIKLAAISTEIKNTALIKVAEALDKKRDEIIQENKKDIVNAEKEDIDEALLKRLKFDDKKVDGVIKGIKDLVSLDDPVGKIISETELDKGLMLKKQACPIGVIGIIFESRPDALVQISTLCLKSGNAVILKGGKEALNTNKKLFEIIKEASLDVGIPEGWINLFETRGDVKNMLKMEDVIDLIIPRGSNSFVKYVMDNTNITVLGHSDGICHVYVDDEADMDMALNVCRDSKCQYAAVCNAMETLLMDENIAGEFLPKFKEVMDKESVQLRGCTKTCNIIDVDEANQDDWETEYNSLVLSIKIVDGIDEAIEHINHYGSHHTDAIITSNDEKAEKFMKLVNSADVFHNCSTRFADGYRYGLGAEVGISTLKIHARGPVGLEGLMIYKWKLYGNGQVVDDYAKGNKEFAHKKIS